MADLNNTLTKNWRLTWPDAANFVFGAWLFLSPFVLAYSSLTLATWNAMVVGAVIAIMAIAAIMEWRAWEEWISVALGLWLVVSPWVLGFAAFASGAAGYGATLNAIIMGLVVLAVAGWSIHSHRQTTAGAH